MAPGFTLRQLEYLVAVADHGSFAAAARAVHVSGPGLLEQINRLEAALAARLFDRSARTVHLTETGVRVLAHARAVLAAAVDLEHEAAAGDLCTIAAIPTMAPYLLPGLFAPGPLPPLRFLPVEAPTATAAQMLDARRCDAALLAAGTVPDRFATIDVGVEPLYLALPADASPADRVDAPADPEVLGRLEMLLLGGEHCLRDQVVDLCRQVGAHRFRRPLEAASLELVVALVAAGAGATIVPAVSVPSLAATPNVRFVALAGQQPPTRRLVLAYRPTEAQVAPAALLAAADLLRSAVTERTAAAAAIADGVE